jgi:hypothetical protein
MYRLLAVAAAALVCTGCATPLEVSSITEIQSTTGARGVDVYQPRREKGQADIPEFAGDQLVEVRTYAYEDGKGQVEMTGATCDLSAADFKATMTTPAKVRVPLYRAQSSQLAVSCEKPGFQRRMVTVQAVDSVRQQRLASGANGGLLGVAVSAIADAAADNSKNAWTYPVAKVVLEPVPPAKK